MASARAAFLAAAITLAALPAAAQPSAEGGFLYLTSDGTPPETPIVDGVYELRADPGTSGSVPLGTNVVYVNTDTLFVHLVETDFTFLGNVTVRFSVECGAVAPPAGTIAVSLLTSSYSVGFPSQPIPTPCSQGAVTDLEYGPVDLDMFGLAPGQTLTLEVRTPTAASGEASLSILTGDAAHPATVSAANWTSEPLFLPWVDSLVTDSPSTRSSITFWSSGADSAQLVLNGTIAGSESAYAEVTVYDLVADRSIGTYRVDMPPNADVHNFTEEYIINAGPGTHWRLTSRLYSPDGGMLNATMSPVTVEVTEQVAPPAENTTDGNSTTPPPPSSGKDSPALSAPLLLASLAAIAVVRARRK